MPKVVHPFVFSATIKVFVTADEIRLFNASWPCSTLRSTRSYWFEFDTINGELTDTDCPESDDGEAASAIAEDCKRFYFEANGPFGSSSQARTDANEDY